MRPDTTKAELKERLTQFHASVSERQQRAVYHVVEFLPGVLESAALPCLRYFELRFDRLVGGTIPFSGRSCSIGSERWCSGLSSADDSCGPASGTVNPCAVFMASLYVEPDFAAATAKMPWGVPLLKAVAM